MSKLLLIGPAGLEVQGAPGKQVHHLNLAILAALGEDYFTNIEIVEESFAPLELNQSPDLVGITMMTSQAKRAYWLADHFRRRGSKVIVGGSHVSFRTEEALQHADAVVQGEVEGIWPEIMTDFGRGDFCGKKYRAEAPPDLAKIPIPRKDLFPGRHTTFNSQVIQSTRGCPLGCEFCTVTKLYGKKFRTRPVEDVVEEIKRYPERMYFFVDDNILFSHKYAYELLEALVPLRIKWGSQTSLASLCSDKELLKLAVRSGCVSMFVGFESISQESLDAVNKGFNHVDSYASSIEAIQTAGIAVLGAFVFGFENDTPQTIADTLEFVKRNNIAMVSTGIMTPFPGSDIAEELERQGRIFDRDYEHYTGGNLVWHHPNFEQDELEELYFAFRRKFYSVPSIAKRFWANRRQATFYLAMNISHYLRTRHRLQGRQFEGLLKDRDFRGAMLKLKILYKKSRRRQRAQAPVS
jgi:radical SAM superfamily enzyme YgiQ (UPF0313 family)